MVDEKLFRECLEAIKHEDELALLGKAPMESEITDDIVKLYEHWSIMVTNCISLVARDIITPKLALESAFVNGFRIAWAYKEFQELEKLEKLDAC